MNAREFLETNCRPGGSYRRAWGQGVLKGHEVLRGEPKARISSETSWRPGSSQRQVAGQRVLRDELEATKSSEKRWRPGSSQRVPRSPLRRDEGHVVLRDKLRVMEFSQTRRRPGSSKRIAEGQGYLSQDLQEYTRILLSETLISIQSKIYAVMQG